MTTTLNTPKDERDSGRTVIYVAPVEFGGIENATLETRHDRARVSGIYR